MLKCSSFTSIASLAVVFLFHGYSVAAPPSGYGLAFDGDNDAVVIPDSRDTFQHLLEGQGTIEFWAKPAAPDKGHRQFAVSFHGSITPKHRDLNVGISRGGNWWFTLTDGNRYVVNQRNIMPAKAGKWRHVVVVLGGKDRGFYLDGDRVTGWSQFSAEKGPWETDLHFGRAPEYGGRNWLGEIGDVRIWQKSLTPSEIDKRMSEQDKNKHAPALSARWPMDEGSGEAIKDVTGAHDGRMMGHPEWRLHLAENLSGEKEVEPGDTLTLGPVSFHDPRGEVRYQWYFDGKEIDGATGNTFKISDIEEGDLGSYYCRVEDQRGIALTSRTVELKKRGYWRFPGKTQEAYPLPADSEALDRVVFGSKPSERAHELARETSRIFEGQHGHLARRLQFPDDHAPAVGSVSFTMNCDPEKHTYLTVKLDASPAFAEEARQEKRVIGKLLLFDGTEQVGYVNHNMDWPTLVPGGSFSLNDNTGEMVRGSKGDWVYFTMLLPKSMTEGRDQVDLRIGIRGGPTGRSIPFYRAYTHTDPLFDLPNDEEDTLGRDIGTPLDTGNDDPVAILEQRVNAMVKAKQQKKTVGGNHYRTLRSLATAYSHDWIDTLDRDAIFSIVRDTIDKNVRRQAREDVGPRDVASHGHNWHTHGALARSFELLSETFEKRGALEEYMPEHPDAPITRRKAYTDFFLRSYDWRQGDRRRNTNQVMFVNLGLVEMGEALQALDPERAPSEQEIDRWVNEGFGIEPMTLVPDKPDRVKPIRWEIDPTEEPHNIFDYLHEAEAWHSLSRKGLNREPRYSDSYSGHAYKIPLELIQHTADPDRAERVKERLSDAIEAMGEFRSLAKNPDGHTVAYQEGPLGYRGGRYPGAMNNWYGYGLYAPAYVDALGNDEVAKRWAKLWLEHGRYTLKRGGIAENIWMKEGIEALRNMEPSTYKLPWERERSVWADHTAFMVNIVDGEHRLMVSMGHGNMTHNSDMVRFDYEGPESDRIGTTKLRRKEIPLYETRERGNNLYQFGDAGKHTDNDYYFPWKDESGHVNQAIGGTVDLAAQPNGEPWPGHENPIFVEPERASTFKRTHEMASLIYFYREAKIGPYLIGMNSTGAEQYGFGPGKEYQMEVPEGGAIDVATGENMPSGTITIGPEETRVLKVREW